MANVLQCVRGRGKLGPGEPGDVGESVEWGHEVQERGVWGRWGMVAAAEFIVRAVDVLGDDRVLVGEDPVLDQGEGRVLFRFSHSSKRC